MLGTIIQLSKELHRPGERGEEGEIRRKRHTVSSFAKKLYFLPQDNLFTSKCPWRTVQWRESMVYSMSLWQWWEGVKRHKRKPFTPRWLHGCTVLSLCGSFSMFLWTARHTAVHHVCMFMSWLCSPEEGNLFVGHTEINNLSQPEASVFLSYNATQELSIYKDAFCWLLFLS